MSMSNLDVKTSGELQGIGHEANDREIKNNMSKSVDSWWRTHSATMALLKHAYHRIAHAEEKIAEQEKQIQALENLAASDPLTGLMNRRGFEKFFDYELARIQRHKSSGSLLVLIDLDYFKIINDTYGHLAGDNCLKLVSQTVLDSIRMLDGAARLGGDEFALLLTQTDPEKAVERIQLIKQVLNEIKLDWQGEKLHFGASIGVAHVTEDSDFEGIYHAADTDLYADKQRRRQRDKLQG
jgi:diguanylate cyclase (GGDEF)-like protein